MDLAGERHKPAATLLTDRGRQNPRGPLLQPTGELTVDSWVFRHPSRGRVTWWRSASTRIAPVENRHADRPWPLRLRRGNPTRTPARRPCLESAQLRSPLATRPGPSCRLPWSFRPPGRDPILGAVPCAPQRRQCPGDLDILAGGALLQTPLDQLQSPVVREPGPAHMGRERALLARSRVQREPVRLVDDHAARSLVAVTARIARFRAPRRP